MEFTKMHGLGNDYIFLYCPQGAPEDAPELSRRLSHRHFGVGSDGLICICPSDRGDFSMVMFNTDGSEGAMCGNGIRCLGKYVYDRGLTRATRLDIETASGMRRLELEVEGGRVSRVTVDMGSPRVERPLTLRWNGLALEGVPVWVGNPHFVVETEDPWNVDLTRLGPMVEGHPAFPGGVNGEFVRVTAPDRLEMRVWERGSGETLACGTGACAAAAAMMTAGKLDRQSTVSLAGGELEIRWGEDGHVYMTGPAVTVFDGKLAD